MPPTPTQHEQPEEQYKVTNPAASYWMEQFKRLAGSRYRQEQYSPGQWPSPEYPYAEGYQSVTAWLRATMEQVALREAKKGEPMPEYGPVSEFVETRLGYLPSYWEDPRRIANW